MCQQRRYIAQLIASESVSYHIYQEETYQCQLSEPGTLERCSTGAGQFKLSSAPNNAYYVIETLAKDPLTLTTDNKLVTVPQAQGFDGLSQSNYYKEIVGHSLGQEAGVAITRTSIHAILSLY